MKINRFASLVAGALLIFGGVRPAFADAPVVVGSQSGSVSGSFSGVSQVFQGGNAQPVPTGVLQPPLAPPVLYNTPFPTFNVKNGFGLLHKYRFPIGRENVKKWDRLDITYAIGKVDVIAAKHGITKADGDVNLDVSIVDGSPVRGWVVGSLDVAARKSDGMGVDLNTIVYGSEQFVLNVEEYRGYNIQLVSIQDTYAFDYGNDGKSSGLGISPAVSTIMGMTLAGGTAGGGFNNGVTVVTIKPSQTILIILKDPKGPEINLREDFHPTPPPAPAKSDSPTKG